MTTADTSNEGMDSPPLLKGELVYFYACDMAYELRRTEMNLLLGEPLGPVQIGPSRRSPRQQLFYVPRMARLKPVSLRLPLPLASKPLPCELINEASQSASVDHGDEVTDQAAQAAADHQEHPHAFSEQACVEIEVQRQVKVLPIGAVSITLRFPFAVGDMDSLIALHEAVSAPGGLHDHARVLAEELRQELAPLAIRPVAKLQEGEDYTVICLETPQPLAGQAAFDSEAWFQNNRRNIAALVTLETDSARLSQQEALESTSQHISYYQTDLLVADWEAALVVEKPGEFEESLYALEVANFQLEELIAYDRLLDAALERSYADLQRPPKFFNIKGRALLPHLREVRIDLARFSDELSNITKFFGDWHLARLYETVARRFHLADWHRTLDDKLRTLDGLYEMLKQEQNHRLMVLLEASIVVMFLIDIVMLVMGLIK